MPRGYESIRRACRDFVSQERGNIAIIFGLTLVPLMLLVVLGVDYARVVSARSNLQQATDSAALAVARNIVQATTDREARAQAQIYLANNARGSISVTSASISPNRLKFCLGSKVQIGSAFSKFALNYMGVDVLNASAAACADMPGGINGTYEIALVLDNSGSMRGSTDGVTKMKALQNAANDFVVKMFEKSSSVKFSIVPFAAGVVAVDPTVNGNRNAAWVDKQGENSQHWIVFGGKTAANAAGFSSRFDIFDKLKAIKSSWDWGGCFEQPKYPLNVNDTTPTPTDPETLLVPYLAPDEPDAGYDNDYIDDDGTSTTTTRTSTGRGKGRKTTTVTSSVCSDVASGDWAQLTHVCKYNVTAAAGGGSGPNSFCPNASTQTIMRLTPTRTTVTAKIDQLVAAGNTNLHEGFMWGWRALSPNLPFAGGRSYSAPHNHKVIVFMTDGFNNWQSDPGTVTGSTYQAAGYYSYNGSKNKRFPDGTAGDFVDYQTTLNAAAGSSSNYHDESREMQDELTLEACNNAKAAGVEVYTIGFSTPLDPIDSQGLALLRACATNVDHYFAATNAAQLNAAFSTIGVGLGKLRLSQ